MSGKRGKNGERPGWLERCGTDGAQVSLTGTVRSIAEKEDAENAAWAAPGVITVENKLLVIEPEYAMA